MPDFSERHPDAPQWACRLHEDLCEVKEASAKVLHLITGNGTPQAGIAYRLAQVEEQVGPDKDGNRLRDRVKAAESSIGTAKWIVGTVAASVAGLLVKVFGGSIGLK